MPLPCGVGPAAQVRSLPREQKYREIRIAGVASCRPLKIAGRFPYQREPQACLFRLFEHVPRCSSVASAHFRQHIPLSRQAKCPEGKRYDKQT